METLYELARLSKVVSVKRDASTYRRWCSSGLRRASDGRVIRLKHQRLGASYLVSVEAVRRFLAELSE